MIWAVVMQEREYKGGPLKPCLERGVYGFAQLPSPGDHVQILKECGRIDLLQVLRVQHTPAHRDGEKSAVHVICQLVGEDI